MNKELQDHIWAILPKEFKEEVTKEYEHQISIDNEQAYWMLERIFGKHNLTSDAEGEDMLTVSRKEVQKVYKTSKEIVSNEVYSSKMYSMHIQIMCVLENLFGSKCLTDDACNVASSEPKPTEPKFKVGDTVRYKGQNHEIGKIVKYWGEEDPGKYSVRFGKEYHNISESMLELYEPDEILSLKEKYWQTGNIFEMSTGERRVVWFDNLIDAGGFIPKTLFNDNLVNTNSTIGEHVIRIYAPNKNAAYFKELTKIRGKNLLWEKSDYIFTEQEIKEKLRIPEDEELIIIKR